MRASDKILHDALKDAGLDDLAERAGQGEWNDYFGKHALNLNHLSALLESRKFAAIADALGGDGPPDKAALDAIAQRFEGLQLRVRNGDFDGTQEEAREWGDSDEGRQVFNDLVSGR